MATKRRAGGEGSVFQRADGTWVARTAPDALGKRVTFYGVTRNEAMAKRAEFAAKGNPTNNRETLAFFLERWLAVRRPSLKHTTWARYKEVVDGQIIPALGGVKLSDLESDDVRAFLADVVARGGAPKKPQAVLATALAQAVRDRRIARNVAETKTLGPLPRYVRGAAEPLDARETRALLEHLESLDGPQATRWRDLFSLYVTLGLRLSEATGLDASSVNGGVLSVRQQLHDFSAKAAAELRTRKPPEIIRWVSAIGGAGSRFAVCELKSAAAKRELPMLPVIAERMATRARGLSPTDLLFTTENGTPLSRRAVHRRWNEVLVKAGLGARRVHDARHGAGSLMVEGGVDLVVVSAFLGHADPAMTARVYVHVRERSLTGASERLGELLKPRTP